MKCNSIIESQKTEKAMCKGLTTSRGPQDREEHIPAVTLR